MQATAMSKFGPSSGDYLLTNTLCCKYGPDKDSKIIENEDVEEPVLVLEVPTTLHGKLFQKSHPLILKKLTLKTRIDQDNNIQIWNHFNSIAQEVMIDKLVAIWFEMKNKDINSMIYFADKVIPVIVLGIVKVLKKVTAKNLLGAEIKNTKFNPLNVLAQYILRFNPRYDTSLELNSYVHGMRWVVDKLKNEHNDVYHHDILAKLIKEARVKRLANERVKLRRKIELENREVSLTELFEAWKYNYKVTIIDLKNALYSYSHYIKRFSEINRNKAKLNCDIYDPNFMNEDTLFKLKFVENMMNLVKFMPKKTYDMFFKFMMVAAKSHQQQIAKEERRKKLEKVFNYIAVEPSETINKQKVICLLIYFYNNQPDETKKSLHHPKKWPMLDILEMNPAKMEDLSKMLTSQKDTNDLEQLRG